MDCNKISKEIKKEMLKKLHCKDKIISNTINEEVLRDLSCKVIYDNYTQNYTQLLYEEVFAQEVPYSKIVSEDLQKNFKDINRAKLDTYFKERSHACAIEFKCFVGDNLALPKRAGLFINDLFRLYQITESPFEERYLIYLTDNQVEKYAYENNRRIILPLKKILSEEYPESKLLLTYDDVIGAKQCNAFKKAAFKSFCTNKANLKTVIERVAHEEIEEYDLYMIKVYQNPRGDFADVHIILKLSDYMKDLTINKDIYVDIESHL